MRVSGGSKIRNLMGYAMKKMKEPEVQQISWNASGLAIGKAISCAEIMKRKIKDLHQINKIRFHRIEEYWEPKVAELERLRVNRDLPAITILLSKLELDTSFPGYQPPGNTDTFLQLRVTNPEKRGDKRKPPRQRGGPEKSAKDAADGASVSSWQRESKKGRRKDSFNKQMQQKKQKQNQTGGDHSNDGRPQQDRKNTDVPMDT